MMFLSNFKLVKYFIFIPIIYEDCNNRFFLNIKLILITSQNFYKKSIGLLKAIKILYIIKK